MENKLERGWKGNFTPPYTHTVNATELQSNKKVAMPPFLHQPPPFSSKIFSTPPPKFLKFWKVLLPPFNNGAEGGVQVCLPNHYQIALSKIGSRVAQK